MFTGLVQTTATLKNKHTHKKPLELIFTLEDHINFIVVGLFQMKYMIKLYLMM